MDINGGVDGGLQVVPRVVLQRVHHLHREVAPRHAQHLPAKSRVESTAYSISLRPTHHQTVASWARTSELTGADAPDTMRKQKPTAGQLNQECRTICVAAAHRAVVEISGKLLPVQRGRCDDQPQVRPASVSHRASAPTSLCCACCCFLHACRLQSQKNKWTIQSAGPYIRQWPHSMVVLSRESRIQSRYWGLGF